ncbi:MAG: MFS transporter, partial [Pseudomonadota bacterium]
TGFAIGGILMGRLVDRFGVAVPVAFGAIMLSAGYFLSSLITAYWQFVAIQGLFIGLLGSSVSFGPLVADISLWFKKRRGLAVAVVASGNYLAGTVWPPIIQEMVVAYGWRITHIGIGLAVLALMLPCALLLRRPPPVETASLPGTAVGARMTMPLSKPALMSVLVVAGLACCIAMSMPQVHIVAYCIDLGYGPARGAEMLSLMLGFGIVSRLVSGVIADKIGGLGTLLLGSTLQCIALFLYLPFDGLVPLYVVSAIFGLSQGGIVPSYALIVRDYFPAKEAGTRVSIVMMATVMGMAVGGWMSGLIYDATGSYQAAFWNGIAFNVLNMAIAFWLLTRRRPIDDAEAAVPRNAATA